MSSTGREERCPSSRAWGDGGRGLQEWVGLGQVGQPHLLTAQLALVFSLGAVPVEVTGLPKLEDGPVPAGKGTLQGHLGARGCSWRAHRDTSHWSVWVALWEGSVTASLCLVISHWDTHISIWLHAGPTPGG